MHSLFWMLNPWPQALHLQLFFCCGPFCLAALRRSDSVVIGIPALHLRGDYLITSLLWALQRLSVLSGNVTLLLASSYWWHSGLTGIPAYTGCLNTAIVVSLAIFIFILL